MENRPDFGPRIYYQTDAPAGGLPIDDRERSGRGVYDRSYAFAEQSFLPVVEDLRVLDKATGKDKDAARERLARNWENIASSQTKDLQQFLDRHLLRFKNPYPFDTRQLEAYYDGLQDAIFRARQESEAQEWGEEAGIWLDKLELDTTWGQAEFELMMGLGSVLNKFFDGKLMLQWVKEGYRNDPTNTTYDKVFSARLPGLELPDKFKDGSSTPEQLTRNIREKAVKWQAQNDFWRRAVAAVHQIDPDDPNGKDKVFMKGLTDAQVEFIRAVFAVREKQDGQWERQFASYKGRPMPKELLNWSAMASTGINKQCYFATMEALLELNVFDELKDPKYGVEVRGDGGISLNEELTRLVGDVDNRVKLKLGKIYSPRRTLEERLASVVVRSGVVIDWGHFSVSRMYWGWNFREKEGTPGEYEKKKDEGGTPVATDIPNMANWLSYYASTYGKIWTVGMLPPMSDGFVETLANSPSGYAPRKEYGDAAASDAKLQAALKALWAPGPDFAWDDDIKKRLQDGVWYWETPVKDHLTGKNIVIPIFFPPEYASMNFLNVVSLEGKRSIKKGDPSVWDQLNDTASGKDLSNISWIETGDQALYQRMITWSQVFKILTVMTEPQTKNNEGQFMDFFLEPAKAREFIKRLDLNIRDEKELQSVLTLALGPMLVVLYKASQFGIIGPDWESKGNEKGAGAWGLALSKWIVEFRGLPNKSGDGKISRYGRALARMTKFYAKIVARMAFEVYLDEKQKIRGANKELVDESLQDTQVVIEKMPLGGGNFPTLGRSTET